MCDIQIILVVEDQPILRMVAAENLLALGFDVIEAQDADEAIAVLESRSDIHAVFTDIDMPGSMDGLELAHYVRNRWPSVKIVTTSGKARLSADELPNGGRFLPKPYSAADLGDALRAVA